MTNNAVLSNRAQIILVAVGIIFILYLFSLLRKQKISESHGLLWLSISFCMIIIVSNDRILMAFTHALGAQYPSSALAMIGLLFIFVFILFFTIQITQLTLRLRMLVQEIGLENNALKQRIKQLERTLEQGKKL